MFVEALGVSTQVSLKATLKGTVEAEFFENVGQKAGRIVAAVHADMGPAVVGRLDRHGQDVVEIVAAKVLPADRFLVAHRPLRREFDVAAVEHDDHPRDVVGLPGRGSAYMGQDARQTSHVGPVRQY